MITVNEIFDKAINHWRDKKGIGTAIIPYPLNDKLMVLGVLQRIYARSPTAKVVIVTTCFAERLAISEFITQQEDAEENNKEFKNLLDSGKIKVFTDNYIVNNKYYNPPLLCICYRLDSMCQEMIEYVSRCKFKLIVLNKIPEHSNELFNIYKVAPLLSDFQQAEVEQIRLSTPIEETQIGVIIPEDSQTKKELDKCNEYVATSINIFGSLDVMNQANIGNIPLNLSSTQICYQIATENGWHNHLDMSVEFNVELDNLYNPNNLKERAENTYEIIRTRSKLLSDFDGKLDAILDIVRSNKDKKVLIINKRAEFASIVTEYINNLSDTIICANYHDKVENIPAVTLDGTPLYYKSGSKKGERRQFGAKAQKTLNEERFNHNYINVLSTNNAPDKDLNVDIDIIIITSPMCEDIKTYIYRLSKLRFTSKCISLYSIYCRNTSEQKLIENKEVGANHNIIHSSIDESDGDFSDFTVVD